MESTSNNGRLPKRTSLRSREKVLFWIQLCHCITSRRKLVNFFPIHGYIVVGKSSRILSTHGIAYKYEDYRTLERRKMEEHNMEQVRKSLFPPRPKQKRKMRSIEIAKNGELSDSSTTSSSESLLSSGSRNRNRLDSRKLHGKSRSSRKMSTVGTSESDSGADIVIEKTPSVQKQLKDTDMVCPKASVGTSEKVKGVTLKRKVLDEIDSIGLKKRRGNEEVLPADNDIKNKHLQLQLVFKDSGFSSCSSQERTPTEDDKLLFDETSSQETIESVQESCQDVADKVLGEVASYPKDRHRYTTLSQISCMSADSALYSRKTDTLCDDVSVLRESQSSDFAQLLAGSDNNLGSCMFCLSEPKNSVFVHSNFVHLCCCYKCAMKVWKQRKSCPICNCKVKNVMKLFVH